MWMIHSLSSVAFFSCCWSVEIWFTPKKTFLHNYKSVLRCHVTVETFPFKHDFIFYENGNKLRDEGGAPHVVSTREPEVYYDLIVEKPANYTCEVDGNNTTAELVEMPDDPVPLVVKVSEDAIISCPQGPSESENTLEIINTNIQCGRLKRTSRNYAVIQNIGHQDIFNPILCHYKFPWDNIMVSTEVRLIVMNIEVTGQDLKSTKTFSCIAYPNATDINLTLTTNGKDLVYSISGASSVSEDYDKNVTDVNCSLWYNGKEIWSESFSLEEETSSSAEESGLRWYMILINVIGTVFILVIIIIVSVKFGFKKCRQYNCGYKKENEAKSDAEVAKAITSKLLEENEVGGENKVKKQDSKEIKVETIGGAFPGKPNLTESSEPVIQSSKKEENDTEHSLKFHGNERVDHSKLYKQNTSQKKIESEKLIIGRKITTDALPSVKTSADSNKSLKVHGSKRGDDIKLFKHNANQKHSESQKLSIGTKTTRNRLSSEKPSADSEHSLKLPSNDRRDDTKLFKHNTIQNNIESKKLIISKDPTRDGLSNVKRSAESEMHLQTRGYETGIGSGRLSKYDSQPTKESADTTLTHCEQGSNSKLNTRDPKNVNAVNTTVDSMSKFRKYSNRTIDSDLDDKKVTHREQRSDSKLNTRDPKKSNLEKTAVDSTSTLGKYGTRIINSLDKQDSKSDRGIVCKEILEIYS